MNEQNNNPNPVFEPGQSEPSQIILVPTYITVFDRDTFVDVTVIYTPYPLYDEQWH
jgi:hypothetical protein